MHAVLLWDNAGYHVAKGLVVPANVSLIGLLPYSPELNPVENRWHYLRSHYWSLRVYRDYEALEEAAMTAVAGMLPESPRIKSQSSPPWTVSSSVMLPNFWPPT